MLASIPNSNVLSVYQSRINTYNHIKKFIQRRNTMTTRPIYTDINAANAEIRDMETHMNVMKRMISTQSERIENFKDLVEVLKKQIESHATLRESHLKLMEAWLNALENDNVGLVMESIDRTLGNNKIKETI